MTISMNSRTAAGNDVLTLDRVEFSAGTRVECPSSVLVSSVPGLCEINRVLRVISQNARSFLFFFFFCVIQYIEKSKFEKMLSISNILF